MERFDTHLSIHLGKWRFSPHLIVNTLIFVLRFQLVSDSAWFGSRKWIWLFLCLELLEIPISKLINGPVSPSPHRNLKPQCISASGAIWSSQCTLFCVIDEETEIQGRELIWSKACLLIPSSQLFFSFQLHYKLFKESDYLYILFPLMPSRGLIHSRSLCIYWLPYYIQWVTLWIHFCPLRNQSCLSFPAYFFCLWIKTLADRFKGKWYCIS